MKLPLRGHRWVLAAPLLLLMAACSGGDEDQAGGDATADTTPAVTQAPPPPPPGSAGALTDGNIVAILAASGQSEIVPSQAVVGRTENASVNRFAQHMITQHTALGDTVSTVAQQNGITPAPDAVSMQLDSTGNAMAQQLRGLSGAQLDSVFMQYMVTSHEGALRAVNEQLIPSAQNPQLRAALPHYVRPVVQAHLQWARALVDSLGSR